MTPMPMLFQEAMSSFGEEATDAWWAELDEGARAEVLEFWYASTDGEAAIATVIGRSHRVEETGEREVWHNDFYEYLSNHEVYYMPERTFHVCTEHQVARQAVRSGEIPGDFQCPLGREACPMRTLLRHSCGQSVRLSLAFKPRHSNTDR